MGDGVLISYGQKIDTVTMALGYPSGAAVAGGEGRDELMEWARACGSQQRERVSEVIDEIEDPHFAVLGHGFTTLVLRVKRIWCR